MEMWTESRFTRSNRGMMGVMGSITTWLGVIFALIGIIGDASDSVIGLYPTSWFLLAIASLIFGLSCWLGWAVGIYLHHKETETKK
ncbi:MAG TPA: hypothetical protein G4O16_00385 [Dehalococcoidia bacterium]|nr:hypothetical protein [Dehalococcoidia bacterium]